MDGCIASCRSIVSIHPSIAQVVLTFVECDEAARRLTVARSFSFEKWSGNLNRMDWEFPLLLFALCKQVKMRDLHAIVGLMGLLSCMTLILRGRIYEQSRCTRSGCGSIKW